MLNKKKLYAISFIEGASVMAAEIGGVKLVAPFFGSSLYVWSSVMAITLGGLASGYFLGGQLSKRNNKELVLLYVLTAAVCSLSIMPFITHLFYPLASSLSLIPAVIISVFILLFPTMLCMGATSPLIISLLTSHVNESGENSGRIYATSTIGGITATFLCGFYLIPNVGVTLTLIFFAIALALSSLLLLSKKKSKPSFIFLLGSITFAFYGFVNGVSNKNTIYKAEGMLGKLEVRDERSFSDSLICIRKLLVNTITQTEMNLKTKQSVSEYVTLLERNSSSFPTGKALLLGLGGGAIANMLVNHKYEVTGVEFDNRIIEIAKRFFYLQDSIKIVCDDARHFINASKETYNLVLFDVFRAEEQPSYVITKESLVKLKTLLDTNALVLVNTHGYLTGEKGLGTQCLLATLKQSGFNLKICTQNTNEDYRNLLIIASLRPLNAEMYGELKPLILSDTTLVNEDNKPILEKVSAEANQRWRSNYIRNYILHNK